VTIWLDNHLSPALSPWITAEFGEACVQVRDLGLGRASDREIFQAARATASTFITKDRDFADLVRRMGPPPGVVLLSCGNTSTAHVRTILAARLGQALAAIRGGESLVEVRETGRI
jgi:predicted nuclease of predicted toxin-antitoxin system